MDDFVTITKLELESKVLHLKIIWKHSGDEIFHLTVFDDVNSWSGLFLKEAAKDFSERADVTLLEYYQNIKEALKTSNIIYLYEFLIDINNPDCAKLVWKRKYEDGATLEHGTVTVYKDLKPKSKDTLIDYLLEENIKLKQSIKDCHKKSELLSSDFIRCKSELEQFIDMKTSLETSLYGKFVQVLNTKKERIKLLEENISKYEESGS